MKSAKVSLKIGIKSKCVPGRIASLIQNSNQLAYIRSCIEMQYLYGMANTYVCVHVCPNYGTFMLLGCSIIKNLIFMRHLPHFTPAAARSGSAWHDGAGPCKSGKIFIYIEAHTHILMTSTLHGTGSCQLPSYSAPCITRGTRKWAHKSQR